MDEFADGARDISFGDRPRVRLGEHESRLTWSSTGELDREQYASARQSYLWRRVAALAFFLVAVRGSADNFFVCVVVLKAAKIRVKREPLPSYVKERRRPNSDNDNDHRPEEEMESPENQPGQSGLAGASVDVPNGGENNRTPDRQSTPDDVRVSCLPLCLYSLR